MLSYYRNTGETKTTVVSLFLNIYQATCFTCKCQTDNFLLTKKISNGTCDYKKEKWKVIFINQCPSACHFRSLIEQNDHSTEFDRTLSLFLSRVHTFDSVINS